MTDVNYNAVDLTDAVPGALVLNVHRPLLGERRDIRELVPGRAGSWRFGEQAGDRIITIDLNIEGLSPGDRHHSMRLLADWVDVGEAKLIIDDELDLYWLAVIETVPTPEEWINNADVSIDFRVGPYVHASSLSTDALSLTDGDASSLELDDTVDVYPVIEVTAGETMATGFTLTVNGLVLVYGDPVASGDVLTVSALTYTVSTGVNTDTALDGVFVAADLSMGSVDGDFPILIPGVNSITVDGGDADVAITWRRRYR